MSIGLEYKHVPHEEKLYTRPVMNNSIKHAVLERNQALRNNPGALRELDWARNTMSIPKIDWYWLQKKYPDLASPDKQIYDQALNRFMQSSEAAPYLVR